MVNTAFVSTVFGQALFFGQAFFENKL